MAATLASCSTSTQTASNNLQGRDAQTLVMADDQEPSSLNPLFDKSIPLRSAVFSCLFREKANGELAPDLALLLPTTANGGISKDGLVLTYHLRRDVTWQDGKPFTARDVLFTLKQILNPRNNLPFRLPYTLVKSASSPDPFTVRFVLTKIYPPIVARLFAAWCDPILPEHLLSQYSDLNDVPFNSAPIGTGPYRVEHWERGNALTLVRYDGYFRGRPAIKKIVDRFIASEPTLLIMLRKGEIDGNLASNALQANEMSGERSLSIYKTLSMGTANVVFNAGDPIMKSRQMRLAIAHAIDSDRLASQVSYGSFVGGSADKVIFGWAYDPSIVAPRYDRAKAGQILDAQGWKLEADGYRYLNGKKLELTLVTATNAMNDRVAVLLQDQLRQVGVQVVVKDYQPAIIYAAPPGGPVWSGRFALYFSSAFSWNGMDGDLTEQTSCSERAPHGINYARYCNHVADAAYKAGLQTFDLSSRRSAYRQAQRELAVDPPWVGAWGNLGFEIVNKRLRNFEPTAPTDPYADAYKWRL